MTDFLTLPQLELGDADLDFDEAVIIINGHEEETITIDCPGALDLADLIIRLVNEARAPAPPADEKQTPYLAGPARLALIDRGDKS